MPMKTAEEQREYQRKWVRKRRDKWLNDNGPCARCGSWNMLEVDHVNPEDKVSHKVWSWAEDRRNAELSKCQVLCHWCHVRKTWENKTRAQQGSNSKYSAGCRCELCRIAHSEYQARYRAGVVE